MSGADAQAVAERISEGEFARAITLADSLLAGDPRNAQILHLKGVAHARLGDSGAAAGCYNTALQCKPDFKEACLDLASALERMGKFELAVKMYSHGLKIEQAHRAPAPKALGVAQVKAMEEWFFAGEALQKHGDQEKAAAAYRKALDIHPSMPEALTNLGNALYYLKRYAESEQVLLQCLRARPGHADALNTLGTLYKDNRHDARAVAAYLQALDAQPRYLPALINLGNIHYAMKRYGEAIEAYKRILAIAPHHTDILCHLVHLLYRFCDWQEAEKRKSELREALLAGAPPMAPLIVDTLFDSPPLQLGNARKYTKKNCPAGKGYETTRPSPAIARNGHKLRIGYLSADFCDHATLHLISELFERHDAQRFEIHAYSYGPDDGSAASSRVRQSVHRFCDLRPLDDESAARRIAQDGMDILVDLKGYTKDQRLGILASRPAPLQVHYLGFPGSTGAEFIDYFITDSIASPEGADAAFSECLVRLPHSYQINDRKRPIPKAPLPRAAYGLPEEGFVFCDFNNSYKITPELFAVWMRLLKAVEGSVLWLYETHAQATANLRIAASQHGVDPARLIMATAAAQAEHLPRYLHAELVLDTFPVCGHTTTSDALWGGAPVLAMEGETFISRVAASLLEAVGLGQLVAPGLAAYEAMALELAQDKEKLHRLRRHLERGRMEFPLFDSASTACAMETAYSHMAQRHRRGLPPQPFNILPNFTILQRGGA